MYPFILACGSLVDTPYLFPCAYLVFYTSCTLMPFLNILYLKTINKMSCEQNKQRKALQIFGHADSGTLEHRKKKVGNQPILEYLFWGMGELLPEC